MSDRADAPSESRPVAGGLSEVKRELLARRLRQGAAAAASEPAGGRRGIPARPGGEPPPLSHAQERLWFLEQFAPGTAAYT
ncbi:hypothetical protein ACWEPN_48510, partial [Nonomuraea wenchangensis]